MTGAGGRTGTTRPAAAAREDCPRRISALHDGLDGSPPPEAALDDHHRRAAMILAAVAASPSGRAVSAARMGEEAVGGARA